jgi:hypothetical protein
MGRHGADTVAMSGALNDPRETEPGSRSVGPGCPCSLALRPVMLALFGHARNKQPRVRAENTTVEEPPGG